MLKVTPGAAKETELYAGTLTWNTNVIGDQVHSNYLKYNLKFFLWTSYFEIKIKIFLGLKVTF